MHDRIIEHAKSLGIDNDELKGGFFDFSAPTSFDASASPSFLKAPDEDRERIEDAAAAAGIALTDDEADELGAELGGYAAEAAEAGYAQIGGEVGEESDTIFDQINARAAAWAEERAAELVSQVDETTREAVRSAVADGLEEGLTAEEIADKIEGIDDAGGLGAFSEERAALIANTEIASANSQGALVGYREAADSGVRVLKEWLVAGENVCDDCQDAADQGAIELDEIFDGVETDAPPGHPNCLPGSALVSAFGISAYAKRWFEGDLIVICTAAGNDLACTANHPILTDRGWVAASRIDVGSRVISASLAHRETLISPDAEHMPARIEDVAKALRRSGKMPSVKVPVAAEDFHGDGKGSEVAIIGSDRLLRPCFDPSSREHGSEANFEGGGTKPSSFHSRSDLHLAFNRNGDTSDGGVGSFDLAPTLFGAHPFPFESLRIRLRADRNPGLDQAQTYPPPAQAIDGSNHRFGHTSDVGRDHGRDVGRFSRRAGWASGFNQPEVASIARQDVLIDPVLGRKLAETLFGEIFADEIVAIGRMPFAGHVFNLETESHIYLAQGVVTHNCRCAVSPVVLDDTASDDGESAGED